MATTSRKKPNCKKGTPCGYTCISQGKACKKEIGKMQAIELTKLTAKIMAKGGGKMPESLKNKLLAEIGKAPGQEEQVLTEELALLEKYSKMEWPDSNKQTSLTNALIFANGLPRSIWNTNTQRFTGAEPSLLIADYARNNPDEIQKLFGENESGKNISLISAFSKQIGSQEQLDAEDIAYDIRETVASNLDNYGLDEALIEANFDQLDIAEGLIINRKPSTGKYKGDAGAKLLQQQAEDWSKQQGFVENIEVNGFSAEQAKAHDVSHPAMHALTGLTTEKIKKYFGTDSLVHEEALVNVLEHLAAGDLVGNSLMNGIRVAKVLARTEDEQVNKTIRTNEYGAIMYNIALDMLKHPDYPDIAKHVREQLKVSRTVQVSGASTINVTAGA